MVAICLLGGWLGSSIPLTDLGFLDLAHGRSIAATGNLAAPTTGLSPDGENPPTAWLGGRILYLSHQWGGDAGLRSFAALLGAAGAMVLYLAFPGGTGWLLTVLAATIARESWETSTWLFSWPLIAGTLWTLTAFERGSRKWILLIPPFLVLWPNLNHEAVIGFMLVGLAIVAALIEYRRGLLDETPKKVNRALCLIGALAVSTVLVLFVVPGGRANFPNFISYGLLMRETGGPQWSALFLPHHTMFFVFAVFVGALVVRLPSPGWTEKSTLIVSLLLTMISSHFVILFAAAAVHPAARSLEKMLTQPFFLDRRQTSALTRSLVLIGAVTALVSPVALSHRPDHPHASAVDVLARQELSGSLFNMPSVGGLIRWKTDRIQFSDLSPTSLVRFDETKSDDLHAALFSEETDSALVSWAFAEENLKREIPSISRLQLIYLDDSSLLYASRERGPATVELPAFEHFDPFVKPEEYPSQLVPSVTRELFDYLESFPPSLRTLSILGPLLLREERNIEALEVFEAARRIAPNDIDTLRQLSWLYVENGMYGLAGETTRRAMRFDDGVDLVHNYARAIYGQGLFADAVPYFERVLAVEDDNIPALRALVDIHQKLDESDTAKKYRERLDILEMKVAGEFLADAETKKQELDFDGAARAFRRAYEVLGEPRHLWAEAIVLLIEARNEDAIQALQEIVRQRPSYAPAHLTLGMLCAREETCESEESKFYLETFLELAPEDINADLARRELAKMQ